MKEIKIKLTDREYKLIDKILPAKYIAKYANTRGLESIKHFQICSLCRLYLLEKIYAEHNIAAYENEGADNANRISI